MKLLVVVALLFFFCAGSVKAQVVINEFSSWETSGDWVELYAFDEVDISGWILRDKANSVMEKIPPDVVIGTTDNKFFWVDVGNRLNKGGDVIKLLKSDDTTLIDEIFYGSEGGVCAPESGQSAGRYPDGNSTIERFATQSKGKSNDKVQLLPCKVSTERTAPTETAVSVVNEVSESVLKINQVKDENGGVLSSVKIYIDGTYIHHYAPEEIKFCDACDCGVEISCGFGSHLIKLEKSGFKDWSESKNLVKGESVEITVVMVKEVPTPTKSTVTPGSFSKTGSGEPKSKVLSSFDEDKKEIASNTAGASDSALFDQELGIIEGKDKVEPTSMPEEAMVAGSKMPVKAVFAGLGSVLLFSSAVFVAIKKSRVSYNNVKNEPKQKSILEP